MKNILEKISDLVNYLNECTFAYDAGNPIISDKEWDELYFKLVQWERDSKIYLSNSPTQRVNYSQLSTLEKVTHNHPMLSLDKTKDPQVVKELYKHPILAMCKMDGLTCSLTYQNGRLVQAETRGNGYEGENILHNALVVHSIPKKIKYTDELVIDGEIICTFSDFEKLSDKYKNCRNLAAGSIRLLDSRECEKRNLTFVAWEVIQGFSELNMLSEKLDRLKEEGFLVVPYSLNEFDLAVESLVETAKELSYPIDGCVFKYNDIAYGKTLGATNHHFKNAIAYKFYDETYSTKLVDIEWSPGRTGVFTPIAVFEPVDIEGSTVRKASLHNISIMTDILGDKPFVGQEIEVYKSNMINPQVYSAVKIAQPKGRALNIPETCSICGGILAKKRDNETTILTCPEQKCLGKIINSLEHFCGKSGLDIKGISKATLEKLIDWGWVSKFVDIFNLKDESIKKDWIKKPGFGLKSVEKILNAIECSRQTTLSQYISALGIPLIGISTAKVLEEKFKTWDNFIQAVDDKYPFDSIPNFGNEMCGALLKFDYEEAKDIAENYLCFQKPVVVEKEQLLSGLAFVITGRLKHFKRDELTKLINEFGGKVVGSISKNTNYLINNDIESTSAKNITAKNLKIPIISEEDFLQMIK